MAKKDLGNKLQAIEPLPFNLLMDWQVRKISTNLFLGYESKDKKSRRTLFRKPLEKKVTEGDITLATSASQKEEVPLQAIL